MSTNLVTILRDIGEIDSRFRTKSIACTWIRICIYYRVQLVYWRASFRSGNEKLWETRDRIASLDLREFNVFIVTWRTQNSLRPRDFQSRNRRFQSKIQLKIKTYFIFATINLTINLAINDLHRLASALRNVSSVSLVTYFFGHFLRMHIRSFTRRTCRNFSALVK